ncbi:unnamed protein product [Microthlaspi erraticum]|uniref:F-box domain-containing protein n=1 Tax=Microthlaspi erraticum TaxID=1685480 RepID=A0A6D2JAP1_9BRAS|nr:unnamed protein product [Microthlaspi erraticum]
MTSPKQLSPSLLPFELVEKILYRTPIEALFRFKSVSKQWYALFNDKIFRYKHFDLSHERFMLVHHKSFQLSNLENQAFLCRQTPDELHNYNIVNTFHCDGLLLCTCRERGILGETTTKLAVLNPVFSRIKWIQLSSSSKHYDFYGVGYDNVSRDKYKILRIGFGTSRYDINRDVEIYEFESKLWRSINATLECSPPTRCVSMNGNMYWIAREKMMAGSKIESFDFSTETFKPICCVPNGTDCSYGGGLSSFGGDRLSLLHRDEHVKKIELWFTSKLTDDGIVSWSKYFDATPDPLTEISLSLKTFIVKTNNKITIMLWSSDIDFKDRVVYTGVYEMGDEGETKKQVER